MLNTTDWVPDSDGNIQRSDFVTFESLDWKPNPFLQSVIHCKPPKLNQLATEVGIEPEVLDLLKRLGITNESELRSRLNIEDDEISPENESGSNVDDNNQNITPSPSNSKDSHNNNGAKDEVESLNRDGSKPSEGNSSTKNDKNQDSSKNKSNGKVSKSFVSYVATHPDDKNKDPDSLSQESRMALEEIAIKFILSYEPNWKRTPVNNPGFDLFQENGDGNKSKFCEIKSMTTNLNDHPVGLSHTQFKFALEHKEIIG